MAAPLEIEVKLSFREAGSAREAILAAGAVEVRTRHFEDNRIFDNPERDLTERGALLRIRSTSDGRGRLTYKEKVETERRAKIRREWETGLSEPEAVAEILQRAGLIVVYRYQKYRTSFRLEGASVELDETPIGCFVEIEGSEEAIRALAGRLGASESGFIVDDYRALHLRWLEERGLPPGDMLFEGEPERGDGAAGAEEGADRSVGRTEGPVGNSPGPGGRR